jgi:hypothetical protein
MPRKFAKSERLAAEQDLEFELFAVAKNSLSQALEGRRPQELSDDEMRPLLDEAIQRLIRHMSKRLPPSQWPQDVNAVIERAIVNAATFLNESGAIGQDQPQMGFDMPVQELPEKLTDQIPGWGEPAYKKQQAGDPRLPAHLNLSKRR